MYILSCNKCLKKLLREWETIFLFFSYFLLITIDHTIWLFIYRCLLILFFNFYLFIFRRSASMGRIWDFLDWWIQQTTLTSMEGWMVMVLELQEVLFMMANIIIIIFRTRLFFKHKEIWLKYNINPTDKPIINFMMTWIFIYFLTVLC